MVKRIKYRGLLNKSSGMKKRFLKLKTTLNNALTLSFTWDKTEQPNWVNKFLYKLVLHGNSKYIIYVLNYFNLIIKSSSLYRFAHNIILNKLLNFSILLRFYLVTWLNLFFKLFFI